MAITDRVEDVKTLAERDRMRREHRREAVERFVAALAEHARAAGGRYILYGSTATGRDRPTSDIDLLVDLPPEAARGAVLLAEDVAASLGLSLDVRRIEVCSDRVLARIRAEGRVIA